MTLEVAGNAGTEQLSFASGTTVSAIAAAINAVKASTGVSAIVSGGTDLSINSTEFGAISSSASRRSPDRSAVSGGTSGKADGADAHVKVNGADAQVHGRSIAYRTSTLDVEFDLDTTFNKPGIEQLHRHRRRRDLRAWRSVTETDKASVGIGSVSTASLGDQSNGYLSSLSSGGTCFAQQHQPGEHAEGHRQGDQAGQPVAWPAGCFPEVHHRIDDQLAGRRVRKRQRGRECDPRYRFRRGDGEADAKPDPVQASTTVLSQANASPQSALALGR